ncbi:MAG: ACT domain-containing protein [Solobacterium sp.]|nr:ACT domain-containing protein [Solobacterium sp.]
MANDFLIVHKRILPDYLEKVILARRLLTSHRVSTVTEAVRKAGISRNTYYKYKDFVFESEDTEQARKAVYSLNIKDQSGSLAAVIHTLTDLKTSILTISQAIPIGESANVLISLDLRNMPCGIEDLTAALKALDVVNKVYLDALE